MRIKALARLTTAVALSLGSVALAQDAVPSDSHGPTSGSVPAAPAPEQQVGRPIWIGIDASPLSAALAHQLRLKPGVGLVVDHVTYDSPAAKAGIREYDVLQKIDDHLIDNPAHFAALFAADRPGDVVRFTLIREGQTIETKVTLGKPADAPAAGNSPARPYAAPAPPAHHSHGLRLPKINVHIDQRGDLVATDGSGRTLFRQPLDFTIDTPELPFSIHIEPKPGRPDQAQPPDDPGRR